MTCHIVLFIQHFCIHARRNVRFNQHFPPYKDSDHQSSSTAACEARLCPAGGAVQQEVTRVVSSGSNLLAHATKTHFSSTLLCSYISSDISSVIKPIHRSRQSDVKADDHSCDRFFLILPPAGIWIGSPAKGRIRSYKSRVICVSGLLQTS